MAITDWMLSNLPLVIGVIVIPVIVFMIFFRDQKTTIQNRILVFFKGGTSEYFPCEVNMSTVKFIINTNEYNEPILHHPRVHFDKTLNKFFRDYMYAEGIGTVDVPPLLQPDKKKIVETLLMNNIIPDAEKTFKNGKSKSFADYSDTELISYIRFYNFDIEQITDRPMMNSFVTGVNMFSSMVKEIVNETRNMQGNSSSNLVKLVFVIVGIFIGFGFAWALTLKGVI